MTEDRANGLKTPVSQTERRRIPRTPIRRLAYVNLGPYDNGGVVTDISKDGLRFHMVNPVDQGGLVRVSILLGAANQIDAVGELVWMDESRKVGGVRFTVLPAGAAEKIIEWASHGPELPTAASRRTAGTEHHPSASSPASTTAVEPPVATVPPEAPAIPGIAASVVAVAPAPVVQPSARTPWVPPTVRAASAMPNRAAAPMQSSELPPAAPTIPQPSAIGSMNHQPQDMHPNAMPWITHFDPDPPARDSAFFRGILGGISICALLAFVAWFGVRHYGWQNPLTSFASYRNSGVADGDLPSPVASSPLASSPVTPAPAQSQVSEPFATPELDATKTNTPDVPPREPASQPSAAQPLKAKMPAPQPVPPQRQTSPASPGPGASETPQPALSNSASSKPESLSDAPAAAPSTQPALTQTRETALNTPVADEPSSSYSAPAATQPTRAGDTGEAQLQLARQYLDGRGRPRNATVASQLLWSAVEKGNSAAEMDLADLYLHGDGVARNCDQARVLLSVASQKGNYEATQKLMDLNRSGCR